MIDYLNIGGGADITLNDSEVLAMNLYGEGTQNIMLGTQFVPNIGAGGTVVNIDVNSGGAGYIDVLGGSVANVSANGLIRYLLTSELNDTLSVGDGGEVDAALLNEGDNSVDVDLGSVGLLSTKEGDDTITLTDFGSVYTWNDDGGNNELTLDDAARMRFFELSDGATDIAISGDARMEQGEAGEADLDVTLTENGRLEYHKQFGGSFTADVSDNARIDQLIFGDGDSDITVTGNGRVNNMRLETGTHTVSTGDRFFKSAEFWNADFNITVGAGGAGKIDASSETARSQTITTNGYVDSIQIYDDQDVNLTMNAGGGWVRLDDIKDELFINNDFVRTIETRGGRDDIVIDQGGGVGLFDTGDDGDRLKITDGRVDFFDAGGGNDRLNSRNNGELGVVMMGNGSDRAQIRAGFTELLSLGSGREDRAWVRHEAEVGLLRSESGDSIIQVRDEARVEAMQHYNGFLNLRTFDTTMIGSLDTNEADSRMRFSDDARVNAMKLDEGTHDIVTNNGFFESIAMWRSSSEMTIGAGGAGQIRLESNETQTHDLSFEGFVDMLRVGDDQATTLTWGAEGGNAFRLGEGDDVVTGGEGYVTLLSTRGGNDVVTVSGGLEVLRTGAGDDIVTLGDDFIGMVTLGDGNDEITIGTGFVGLTRLGGGDDTLTVDPAYADFGLTIWAGSGDDDVSATLGGDVIYGGAGMDTIDGGAGIDMIIAGEDDDLLTGGADADTFWFASNAGTDVVTDFEQGTDLMRIEEHAGGFGGLGFVANAGDLEVIHDGGTIVLQGLAAATLTEDDFLF